MSAPRPRLSTGTPKISPRESARFRVLIEPIERRRSVWRDVATVGDVLDSPAPERCSVRTRWYSPGREEGGIVAKTCGAKTCPVCIVPWLEKTVGRAWIAWNGGPTAVEDYESSRAWEYSRGKLGIRMQGPDAAIGVLDLPYGDGRRVFIPDEDGLRGPTLDTALIEAVRAIPVPPFKIAERGEPSPTFGQIPKWISTERAVELARQEGLTIVVAGQYQVRYLGTLEDTDWIARMRGAA